MSILGIYFLSSFCEGLKYYIYCEIRRDPTKNTEWVGLRLAKSAVYGALTPCTFDSSPKITFTPGVIKQRFV